MSSLAEEFELYWDATYAIAMTLLERFPDLNPETVGLHELFDLVVALPEFRDDPDLANERLLNDILIVWYEEKSP